MGLHTVDDRVTERIVEIDAQRKTLVAERIVDTARRVRHDVSEVEHILVVDDLVAVAVAGRTFAVAPLVVAGVLAAGDRPTVAHTVAQRLSVVKCRVGFGLGLDDMVDLVAVDTSQRLADGRAAEAIPAFGHLVTADAPSASAGGQAVLIDRIVSILVGQREHLVARERIGQIGRPC